MSGRKSTPEPDPHPLSRTLGTWLAAAVFAAMMVVAVLTADSSWLRIPAGAAAAVTLLALAQFLYRRFLLLAASLIWGAKGIKGVLVYSDSPNWRQYIEEAWAPWLFPVVLRLNWSERAKWKGSLAVRLFRNFVGTTYNFNPSVIVLCGRWRSPLVFRFYHAFRDAKHGDTAALKQLERRLKEELCQVAA